MEPTHTPLPAPVPEGPPAPMPEHTPMVFVPEGPPLPAIPVIAPQSAFVPEAQIPAVVAPVAEAQIPVAPVAPPPVTASVPPLSPQKPKATEVPPPPPWSPAKRALSMLLLTVIIAVSVVPIEFAARHFGIPSSSLKEWEREHGDDRPDIVVIGNSLTYNDIDFAKLGELTGQNILDVTAGGSGTPWWYLAIKNMVNARLKNKPRYAIFVFRDFDLTNPTYNAFGYRIKDILDVSEPDEPMVENLVYKPSLGMIRFALFEISNAYRGKEEVQGIIYDTVSKIVADAAGLSRSKLSNAVSSVMESSKKRAPTAYNPLERVFENSIDKSLLPPMLEELKKQNIQPIFIRAKIKQYVTKTDNKTTSKYVAALKKYFEKNDVIFLDYTQLPELKIEHFLDSIHLNPDGKAIFTQILANDLNTNIIPR